MRNSRKSPLILWAAAARALGTALLLALSLQQAAFATSAEMTLGVEPFVSARTLATAFQSFREFLSEKMGGKVVAVTATNYDQYMHQLLGGEFDIAFVGPHSALLAAQRAGYVPLMKCEGSLKAVLIVEKNSLYQQAQDIKSGQLVALPDHLTMTSMLGAEFFRPANVNFKFNDFHNAAALMMLRGEAAAAVVADSALYAMSPEIRNNIRVIAESKPVPQMVLLVHSRISAERRNKLQDSVNEFIRITDPSRSILAKVGFSSGKPFGEQDMRLVAPYVEELLRRLGK